MAAADGCPHNSAHSEPRSESPKRSMENRKAQADAYGSTHQAANPEWFVHPNLPMCLVRFSAPGPEPSLLPRRLRDGLAVTCTGRVVLRQPTAA